MAEIEQYLRILDNDPTDHHAFEALEGALQAADEAARAAAEAAFTRTRRSLYERGELDAVARLYDLEIGNSEADGRRADLLLERGQLDAGDLLDDQAAVACYQAVLALRPGDQAAEEALEQMAMERDNWSKFVQKNLDEAEASTDRALTTHMYLSAAEYYGRYQPEADEFEAYLRKALESDPHNRKAALHIERLLRARGRWDELIAFLEDRAEGAGKDERVQALLGIAEVARAHTERMDLAEDCMKKVLAMDAAQPRALRLLADLYQEREDWSALVLLYTGALKARRGRGDDTELGMLLQIGMLHWRRLDNMDAAEEYFRRIRKSRPAHPAALDFYRSYHPTRGEGAKLLQVLRQAQKSLPTDQAERRRELSVEIADLAENQLGNPEKAIDAWKSILRAEPTAEDARAALRRLYRKTEKWNALLDLLKDEIERLPEDDIPGRVAGLMDVVEIYRDRLKLDVMVINTYKSILELDPANQRALDDLAGKYTELGRWNDLINVLSRKAEQPEVPVDERARLLREIARLWSERFGNFAQAIKPLEALVELRPDDADAFAQLRDIYTRRRQWRPLIELLGREALGRPPEDRRDTLVEMARLAAERVGDHKLSIELWNRVLELPALAGAGVGDREALDALTHLYERDKRYLALAEVYRRRRALAEDTGEAVTMLEKLGSLLADRLDAPALAAEAFQELLALQPGHSRSLRILRELYAGARDYQSLEALYAELQQWVELVDAFHNIADRSDDDDERRYLLERSAAIAAAHFDSPDKIARAYERLLSLVPDHLEAARALVPIYRASEKWARLLSSYETLLGHAQERDEKLTLHLEIRDLCESKLGSKALAFQWTAKAYQLDPSRDELRADLCRLGAEADQWGEVAEILDARVRAEGVGEDEKLVLLRELGNIAQVRLHQPERARGYQREVLLLVPDDPQAMEALEDLASQLSDWPDLLAVYRRRVELSDDVEEKVELLFKIAFIEEERLASFDDAAATYQRVLDIAPDSPRAMRSLAKLNEARGDWEGLVDVLGRELANHDDVGAKVALLMRIGGLYEDSLERPVAALDAYCEALALAPGRAQIHNALERFLSVPEVDEGAAVATDGDGRAAEAQDPSEAAEAGADGDAADDDDAAAAEGVEAGADGDPAEASDAAAEGGDAEAAEDSEAAEADGDGDAGSDTEAVAASEAQPRRRPGLPLAQRVRVAELLLPVYEQAGEGARIAEAIEVLRRGIDLTLADDPDDVAAGDQALAYDRRLRFLYGERLSDPARAYAAGLRVLGRAPEDADNRAALLSYAAALDRGADLAERFAAALAGTDGCRAPEDPIVRRALATELARLYDELPGAADEAEAAWLEVLELPTDSPLADARAYDALDRIYRTAGRWRELRDLLLRREAATAHPGARKDIVLAICELEEGVLDDLDGAIVAYLRVLDIDPSLTRAYRSLERLLGQAERYQELEELLGRELDFASEDDRVELCYRRAELRARRLDDAPGAVVLLEEVVLEEPGHTQARSLLEDLMSRVELRQQIARILEPLYEQDKRWPDLCRVLRAQRELAASPFEAAELLARVAAVEEDEMARPAAAFETWVEILGVAPSEEGARAALQRLGASQGRWADVAGAYEHALGVVDAADVALASQLLGELAELYDRHFDGNDRAMDAYRRLLDLDPTNPDTVGVATAALDRLYELEQRWADLIDILRRQADWAAEVSDRKRILARVAGICEHELDDREAAIRTWREVMGEDPEDPAALDALERLFQVEDRHLDLVEILRRRVELAGDPLVRKDHLRRIAALQEHQLEDRIEAITAHLEVLDHVPEDRDTLIELGRLYRAEERWADLLDIVERRLAVSEDHDERVSLSCEVGGLLEKHLGREAEALERYARVLEIEPGHAEALGAVEALAQSDDLLMRAAEILRPVYEAGAVDGAPRKLAELLLRVAGETLDPREALRCLREVAHLRENRLGDKAGAFEIAVRALRAGVSEPELPELVNEVERLGSELERPGDLIDIYRDVAPDVLDGELARRLYLDIADLARAVRSDLELARSYYQRVLDDQPDDPRAMTALEGIYRQTEQHEALYDILVRKADMAQGDLDTLVAALSEAAKLCSEHLDRPDEAIAAWEQVLELSPESREAAPALEKLYEAGERHHDLVDLLERRLGYAFTVEEAVSLRYRLGELCEHKLYDPESAIENYSAALGGDPSHARAIEALERYLDDPGLRGTVAEVLEPIYVTHQDWVKLVRIYEIKLDAAEDAQERLALTRYIARLYEEQLEDLEGAMRWCGRVFREIPADIDVREQLARLAAILDKWDDLARIYQEYLDDEPGDPPEVGSVARALGDIYNDRLDEVERALAAYRRVLAVRGEDPDTFERLEEMLRRAERWYQLIEVYDDAVARTAPDHQGDQRRIELYLRTAWVYEQHLDDREQAVNAYRSVRDIDPEQPTALAELDRLYQAEGLWFELAELLGERIGRASDRGQVEALVELRMRLAEILSTRLEDTAGAIDQYELVLGAESGWERALEPLEKLVLDEDLRARIAEMLEPVYRANDWWKKLVVILDTQVRYIDDPTRRVAMLREIAQLHETRGGDERLALEALSRAWREDVRDREVQAELTALAAKLEAWDALVDTLAAGVADDGDPELAAAIWAHIAEIHEDRRNDLERAVAAWHKVLEARDDDPAALAALDRLLAVSGRYSELVGVVERRAALAEDDGTRMVLLHRIASLYEEELELAPEAIEAYKNVLMADGHDAVALAALARLYREQGDFSELVAVLQRQVELVAEPAEKRALYFAAADIYERELSDSYEAMACVRAVLDPQDGDPNDSEALARLDALYQGEAMWPDLVEVLDRRAALEANAAARAELAFRAAQVVEAELMDADAAIERYAAILAFAPGHAGTRAALDTLVGKEDSAVRAAEVLGELYCSEGDYAALAALYERRLAMSNPDPEAKKDLYRALSQVHEERRGDLDQAFEVWARALAEYPADESIQDQLERLAALRGAWDELVTLLEGRLADILDAELEYAYANKLASLYEDALGDLDGAAAKYRQALDVAADERAPLAALDRIYGRAGRFAELAEVLAREAEATLDEAEQCQYLYRLGDLREVSLRDLPGAVAAYRDVLERMPQHTAARAALERLLIGAESVRADVIHILEPLYEQEGDYARLVDLLRVKLGGGELADPLERARIYARIAELAERQL
ncbi:tetratricopeptide repeat protein, partial [Haliangium sp.]|uniref:tetratricopeptide repeat protein n=1 Tax=Haliangium sp. TaxID=2663208 RepID=UPI003D131D87